ncbi:MAG: methyltransferase [Deltaproteobacteria bacterium]|nr:methyltransferase [Deltaproteobacteria bacterium]
MDKEALYQERSERINKAINLEPVDKIPAVYMGIAPAATNMGMSMKDYIEDIDGACDITIAYMNKLGGTLDGINMHPPTRITVLLTLLWLTKCKKPGYDLPDNSSWQMDEKEVMSIEEYDFIIKEGWQAFLGMHLPKVADMAEIQTGQEYLGTKSKGNIEKFRQNGYASVCCGLTSIPFEFVVGARSMAPFFLDCYRMPEKLKEVFDVITPELIGLALMQTELMGVPRIWVGGWRAASALVSPQIWDTLVFPYYVEMVNALAEKGVTSILHWDQDWTRDLGRLKELPAKKCVFNPDGMTDVRKFKEIVGDRMAIMGDVPSSLFAVGTPEDIRNYVKDLVRDVGPTGLILCPGCDAPINAKPENMQAFVDACDEFSPVSA